MTWAITAAAVVGAGTSIYASNQQSKAAKSAAANAGAAGTQARADLMPWTATGNLANQRLRTLLGLGGDPTLQGFDQLYNQSVAGLDEAHKAKYGMSLFDPRADSASRDAQLAQISQDVTNNLQRAGQTGTNTAYGSLLKPFTGADLQNEPGYQFALSEGNKGIDRAASAAGRYDSGATLKALTRYGNDYATTKFDDANSRDMANRNFTLGALTGQSGQGANAAGQMAGIGMNTANAVNGYNTAGADASASGIVGASNAVSGGVGNYLQYQQNQNTLNYLKGLRGGGLGTSWGAPNNSAIAGNQQG